ncbi:hypothetical protein JQU17_04570 [Ponticoccus sp. SC2-23]|uniref:hypothetical protein n=1 Tax=Alexandriicola marinus TaxID=2081710 RepID=UPI000FD8E3FC|nr:hypothetical protein [Alexandriicola marinus]MBM1219461.1 hypothetical protein [Ponticoccus sp. SC6-9]MBM1223467.1 hypothetical protein [Ponticoccus sp. SC6-15]MBM1229274.1 hypothetical protein [Ponticoccus sp. SC6-38]MBM1232433.1 hypothetical protein [Ponticoccus sp. SC6-45]MBM1237617.1 hypothetical protein [Ponticoccus sp. SC6-49]MBM1241444.1 hypothetical protein [Ponticoccus sp. SC2-64]MBM1245957.1 hypothetical protein [Ponticoccus sp. SC6-42]MBM1250435.1 hypothetical protein [Pontico
MGGMLARDPFLSRGEARLVLGCVFTALFGAALAFVVVLRLDSGAVFNRAMTTYEYWIVTSGFIGGGVSVYLSRHALGHSGFAITLRGMASTTFLAALIAGTLALPLYGTMFGPFTLVLIFAASPVVAFLWFCNLFAVHVLVREWQRERNSIFGEKLPEPLLQKARRIWSRLSLGN